MTEEQRNFSKKKSYDGDNYLSIGEYNFETTDCSCFGSESGVLPVCVHAHKNYSTSKLLTEMMNEETKNDKEN